jgi:hypothetical protein
MWLTVFPALVTVAALHPASRANRFQLLIENAGLTFSDRLGRSIFHARSTLYAAALIWLFFGIFDTSVTRSMAGADPPFGVWFRDQVSTTYDPGFISAGVVVGYGVAALLGAVAWFLSKGRRAHGY